MRHFALQMRLSVLILSADLGSGLNWDLTEVETFVTLMELAERGLNIETSEPPGLERGEVGPKLEIADGAPLVCGTCNRVSRRWKALRRP